MRPVAANAPTHSELIKLLDAIHRLYLTVTLLALKSCRDVSAVIEGDVVGKVVHFQPLDRSVFGKSCGYLLNLRRALTNLCVAVHTCARCGNPGYRRLVRRRMTIETLYLVVPGVNLVRKVNGLHRLIALLISQAAKV